MGTEDPILKAVAAATPKLVQILSPLTPEGRQRAIKSALAIFGESAPTKPSKPDALEQQESDGRQTPIDGISQKAAAWLKKNSISQEQLDNVFSIDSEAIDIIASKLPATDRQEQVVQAYILSGLAKFLRTGELNFLDNDARKICDRAGCYNKDNHAKSFKNFGNRISGSKDGGWRLTNPGLDDAAKIIKQLMPTPKS